jgi:hypothetical protein
MPIQHMYNMCILKNYPFKKNHIFVIICLYNRLTRRIIYCYSVYIYYYVGKFSKQNTVFIHCVIVFQIGTYIDTQYFMLLTARELFLLRTVFDVIRIGRSGSGWDRIFLVGSGIHKLTCINFFGVNQCQDYSKYLLT